MIHFFIPVIPECDDHLFFTGKDPEEKKCMADDTPGLYQPGGGYFWPGHWYRSSSPGKAGKQDWEWRCDKRCIRWNFQQYVRGLH